MQGRKNAAIGISPSKALLGYELPKEGDWLVKAYRKEGTVDRQRRNQHCLEIRERQRQFNEKNYVRHPCPSRIYQVGEMVMMKEVRERIGDFMPKWVGPLAIEQVILNEVYSLVRDGRHITVHVDKLRPAPLGNPAIQDLTDSDLGEDDDRGTSSDDMTSEDVDDHNPSENFAEDLQITTARPTASQQQHQSKTKTSLAELTPWKGKNEDVGGKSVHHRITKRWLAEHFRCFQVFLSTRHTKFH